MLTLHFEKWLLQEYDRKDICSNKIPYLSLITYIKRKKMYHIKWHWKIFRLGSFGRFYDWFQSYERADELFSKILMDQFTNFVHIFLTLLFWLITLKANPLKRTYYLAEKNAFHSNLCVQPKEYSPKSWLSISRISRRFAKLHTKFDNSSLFEFVGHPKNCQVILLHYKIFKVYDRIMLKHRFQYNNH